MITYGKWKCGLTPDSGGSNTGSLDEVQKPTGARQNSMHLRRGTSCLCWCTLIVCIIGNKIPFTEFKYLFKTYGNCNFKKNDTKCVTTAQPAV